MRKRAKSHGSFTLNCLTAGAKTFIRLGFAMVDITFLGLALVSFAALPSPCSSANGSENAHGTRLSARQFHRRASADLPPLRPDQRRKILEESRA
jgi:hypothetical protein